MKKLEKYAVDRIEGKFAVLENLDTKEIKLVETNDDKTKKYAITGDKSDLRKKLFEILAKEGITIFEMKKSESSLEDAFIKIIKKEDK